MNRMRSSMVILTLLVATAAPATEARATAIVAATEPTQVQNLAQLLAQVQQQIETAQRVRQQLEHLREQAQSLGDTGSWLETVQSVHSMHVAVNDMHQSTFAGASMLEEFQRTHPGTVLPTDFRGQYDDLRSMNRDSVERALRSIGMHENDSAGEEQILRHLRQNATNAQSQRAAQDAANQLLLEVVRQLQMLNQVVREQLRVTSLASATADQREAHEEAASRARFNRSSVRVGQGRNYSNSLNEGGWAH